MTERKEEQPMAMNAFDLISLSKGLNLGNLFDVAQVLLSPLCSDQLSNPHMCHCLCLGFSFPPQFI